MDHVDELTAGNDLRVEEDETAQEVVVDVVVPESVSHLIQINTRGWGRGT